jgi:hypothetical protein
VTLSFGGAQRFLCGVSTVVIESFAGGNDESLARTKISVSGRMVETVNQRQMIVVNRSSHNFGGECGGRNNRRVARADRGPILVPTPSVAAILLLSRMC